MLEETTRCGGEDTEEGGKQWRGKKVLSMACSLEREKEELVLLLLLTSALGEWPLVFTQK